MKIRSGKAKGRRCVQETKDLLLKYAPELQPNDFMVPVGSVSGSDLLLSPLASKRYPFVFECKNVEKLNIWETLEQTRRHSKGEHEVPVLVFKRNRSQAFIALEFETFLKLLTNKYNAT